jgi:Rieske Fe-S protein
MAEETQLDRRNFLKSATIAIFGFISAVLALPAVVYVIGPALSKTSNEAWLALGSVSKVKIGEPTLFKSQIQIKTGWIVDQNDISVYVYTQNGRDYLALSNICTHLGCRVRWIADQEKFFCPCHNGVFDKQGNVVSGPPPKPLNRYTVKVENDQIYIKGS